MEQRSCTCRSLDGERIRMPVWNHWHRQQRPVMSWRVTQLFMHGFNEACAHFLQLTVQEVTAVVVQATQDVTLGVIHRFSNVIIEDRRSRALHQELAEIWQGGGGHAEQRQAAVNLHMRWEITRGQVWGPHVTDGRTSDWSRPFNEDALPEGSLSVADPGSFHLERMGERRAANSDTLTRPLLRPAFFPTDGTRLPLTSVLPQRGEHTKEMPVLVGIKQRHRMRLLMMKVPKEGAEQRRQRLRAEAAGGRKPSRSKHVNGARGFCSSPMLLPHV